MGCDGIRRYKSPEYFVPFIRNEARILICVENHLNTDNGVCMDCDQFSVLCGLLKLTTDN